MTDKKEYDIKMRELADEDFADMERRTSGQGCAGATIFMVLVLAAIYFTVKMFEGL